MIIYNVTVGVDPSVEKEWEEWMKSVHIPDVMNTKLFEGYKFCRLLKDKQTIDEGPTFAIQYFCKSMTILEEYQKNHAPALQEDHSNRFRNKFVAFRTLMEVVDSDH